MSEEVVYKEIGEHQILGFYHNELFCDCTYKSEHNLSIVRWIGYVPEDVIISAYVNTGFFGKKNNWLVIKNITDLSKLEGSFHQTNKWLSEKYMPKLVEKGFKYSAIVNSSDLFAQLAMGDLLELSESLYVTQIFELYEDAYNWIISQ